MTTNAFLFSWDQHGIEAIIPITQYEQFEAEQTWAALTGAPVQRNPLTSIIHGLLLRARYNPQRHYEIYSVDCSEEMTEESWKSAWEESPQECANLIREKGHKLYSDRAQDNTRIRIQ